MNPTITCYLVDDDHDDQEIFSMAIENLGLNIKCKFASNGFEAIEKLKGEQTFLPDFIFMDLNMPRMNGRQCLAEIKKITHLKEVPVIMYSTSSRQSDIADLLQMGASAYIAKPSSIPALMTELLKVFEQKKVVLSA